MKFGLLTIHDTQNYGSLLQTVSTYKAFEKLGKDITLIDYQNKAIAEREMPFTDRPVKSPQDLIKKLMWGQDQKKKIEGVHNFLKKETKMSRAYTIDTIKEANREFDGFVSGSDIVWGVNITGHDMTYFLDFADDEKKKIAFSSSAGTEWSEEDKRTIKPLLKRYDSISVREAQAAEWVGELTGKRATLTCDPTILWEPSYWQKFVLEDYAPKEKYVLIYAVNPDRKNITDGIAYAEKHNMTPYFVNFYSPVKGTKTIRPVTVEQWITLFAKADVVFSASYHGLLFSMYFKRSVFFYNRGEKSRMISLAEELNIENREGIENNVIEDAPINYDFVYEKLAEKRAYSWDYLKKVTEE
jgi:hypothetical protein